MEYAARWPEPAAPPQDHLYSARPPHHYTTLSHYPQPQPQPQAQPSSYSSAYYPNPQPVPTYTLPSTAAPPAPVAAPAPDPYLAYAPHGGYYVDPAPTLPPYYYGRESHDYALKEAIRQYGIADRPVYAPAPPGSSNGLLSVPPPAEPPRWTTRPNINPRGFKKGPKAVQSAYCGVCKIDCTTREVLAVHKQGKKHKKNLQKLQDSITPKPQKPPTAADSSDKKATVPVANNKGKGVDSEEKTKRKATVLVPEEDLETKKRKVLEGGAEANNVKVCALCNVVVNSQVVFDSHLAGQKHAANVKQQEQEEQQQQQEKNNADS